MGADVVVGIVNQVICTFKKVIGGLFVVDKLPCKGIRDIDGFFHDITELTSNDVDRTPTFTGSYRDG